MLLRLESGLDFFNWIVIRIQIRGSLQGLTALNFRAKGLLTRHTLRSGTRPSRHTIWKLALSPKAPSKLKPVVVEAKIPKSVGDDYTNEAGARFRETTRASLTCAAGLWQCEQKDSACMTSRQHAVFMMALLLLQTCKSLDSSRTVRTKYSSSSPPQLQTGGHGPACGRQCPATRTFKC